MAQTTIGMNEVKSHLSELIDRVQAGETIAITRHGTQVALLTPVNPKHALTVQTIAKLRELRKGSRLNGLKFRELRDGGRP